MRSDHGAELPRRVPLIFLHIPRTGGTTLTRIARRQYPANQIYMIDSRDPAGSAAALSSLPWFAREQLSLVAGHAAFGVHHQVGSGRYITLIRDPVQRVLSHYRYAQQRSEHPLHDLARTMTLDEMLRAGVWPDLSNGQCRALAGAGETAGGAEPDAMFERARANLTDHFALWGLMERYAETLLMARATLGWRHLYYAPENASRPTSSARNASVELETVRRHNALDIALYDELETKFEESLEDRVPDWPRELARLRLQSLLDEPRRRVRSSYEQARLRSVRKAQRPRTGTARNGHGRPNDPGWLGRWIVGGYDWQVGQKEWIRREIVGDYGWSRIFGSFDTMENLLEPCEGLKPRRAYDVGCGTGYESFALASHFESVLAVDCAVRPIVRAGLLKHGSRVRRIRFVRTNASRFEPAERFDLCLCNLMSHNAEGRVRLLHRLATLSEDDGWLVYAEEAQGYAPMEIEAAIANRDVLALRTRLRQLVAGIRGDHGFRFFVAPTARYAVEAVGFEVIKEETSWWRSLPATHRMWCRRSEPVPEELIGEDADYVETPRDLLELRASSPSAENPLAPLLVLADMARYALPPLPTGSAKRLTPLALHSLDSLVATAVDWGRIEVGFTQFADALDRYPLPVPMAMAS